ncbi:CdaR family protein [uncultured Vagococcus sp.]|uniref:CdaR family protein n=1 Tax=uncultured Vagococcus sp. TaxID=189676 RepID=UPI0028D8A073|nr:CdaR family protein [uncultured Vagococcus sp.]
MDKITDSKWFTRILALFFALLLFFNATAINQPLKSPTSDTGLTTSVDDVPIKLKYDENKFYVAGYEATTTVYLKSSNQLLLDIESNSQTRNFKVEADLTSYSVGVYEVPLKVTGLNQAVRATLKDKNIQVRIEKRETRNFNVTTKVNDNLLKNGYSLENISVDPSQVAITSGTTTLDQIDQVVASLDDDRDLSDDLSKRVDVVALDKDGNVLSVIIDPTNVIMKVTVDAPSKSVPLTLKQSGSIPSGIASFKFDTSYENVKISGPREAIDQIESLEVYIDTSKITESKTDTYTITAPENVKVDPVAVEVNITAVKSDKPKVSESTTKSSTKPSSTKNSSSSTSSSNSQMTDDSNQ